MNTKSKTYKREIAALLLVWLIYLVETKPVEVIEVVVFPIFTFSALAFGLQWYSPNGGLLGSTRPTNGGRPQHSSQYPSREDEYTDGGDYQQYGSDYSETPSKGHQTDQRHE
jgi:hypothetical protein